MLDVLWCFREMLAVQKGLGKLINIIIIFIGKLVSHSIYILLRLIQNIFDGLFFEDVKNLINFYETQKYGASIFMKIILRKVQVP